MRAAATVAGVALGGLVLGLAVSKMLALLWFGAWALVWGLGDDAP